MWLAWYAGQVYIDNYTSNISALATTFTLKSKSSQPLPDPVFTVSEH